MSKDPTHVAPTPVPIQRYDLVFHSGGYGGDSSMDKEDEGEWIRWADHAAALSHSAAELAEVRELNNKMATSLANLSEFNDKLEAEMAEAQATIERLTRDKDHLLTKDDGEYIRARLADMVKVEAELAQVRRERDALQRKLDLALATIEKLTVQPPIKSDWSAL